MKKRILFIAAFCIYIAAVLYLCLMRPEDMPQTEMYIFGIPADKAAHFLMFLPFPVLAYTMLWKGERKLWVDICILTVSIVLGIGMAFLTEQLQAMTQYRTSDIKDVYADMTGLGFGSLLVAANILTKKIRTNKNK